AFWVHPTLAFNSLLIAATETGLASFNIEDGAPVATIDAGAPSGLDVGYFGAGATAEGVAVTFDQDAGQFRFYAVDNVDRGFALLPTLMVTPQTIDGFCAGRDGEATALALYAISGASISKYTLSRADAGISAPQSTRIETPVEFADCVVDEADGAVFATTRTGDIYRMRDGAAPALFASTAGVSDIASIALALARGASGDSDAACCGQVSVLDGKTGSVRVFDRRDGAALGAVSISASFDVEAVATASSMTIGSGNFGGAYRDGVLVLTTPSGEGSDLLRLAPWGGVLNALDQPAGAPVNRRSIGDDADDDDDDDTVIDFDALDP
ncbi:MAG: hypothetical protein AAGJ87_12885, partial [Pseudomonadota bacterium]